VLKIIGYKGYRKGSPFDCTIDSNPRDVSGNVIYNFSYYNPDGSPGVIGGGEDSQHNPKYIPQSEEYQEYYISHFKNGQWAKNVAEFIEKVFFKSGKKVYIVAHSMGGPVVRAAMAFYGAGKYVDKVITIGSPNKTFLVTEILENVVINNLFHYKDWQKFGEILELGADVQLRRGGVTFVSTSGSYPTKPFLDILYDSDYVRLNEDSVRLATIAGFRHILYTSTLDSNDGFVPCSQQTLSFAERTPFIFASHTLNLAGKEQNMLSNILHFLSNSSNTG